MKPILIFRANDLDVPPHPVTMFRRLLQRNRRWSMVPLRLRRWQAGPVPGPLLIETLDLNECRGLLALILAHG